MKKHEEAAGFDSFIQSVFFFFFLVRDSQLSKQGWRAKVFWPQGHLFLH